MKSLSMWNLKWTKLAIVISIIFNLDIAAANNKGELSKFFINLINDGIDDKKINDRSKNENPDLVKAFLEKVISKIKNESHPVKLIHIDDKVRPPYHYLNVRVSNGDKMYLVLFDMIVLKEGKLVVASDHFMVREVGHDSSKE